MTYHAMTAGRRNGSDLATHHHVGTDAALCGNHLRKNTYTVFADSDQLPTCKRCLRIMFLRGIKLSGEP